MFDQTFQPAITENGSYILRFRYLKRLSDGGSEEPVELL